MHFDQSSAEPSRDEAAESAQDDVRQGDPRQGDLRDVVDVLRRRWMVIAIATVATVALALAYLAVAPRQYTGVATILIDARTRPAIGDAANATLNASPDAVLVESQIRVIASEAVLRRVVEAEKLADDPEFAASRAGLRTRLFVALGLGHAETRPEDTVARITAALARRIVVKRSERTYVADVQVTAGDPVLAARLANAVVKAYFDDQQAVRSESAARDSDWVLSQVKEMQADLQAADTRAEQYRREHGIIDVNGKLLNEQNLSEASTGLVQARSRAAEAKARYDQVERVIAAGRPGDTLPDALRSPAIDKLRSLYNDISRNQASLRQTLGDRHPSLMEADQQLRDVKRLINDELKRIEAGIANEYQTAQASVDGLEKQVQAFKATTAASGADRVKLDELQRDVDARRAVYDRFLRARDTVREQAADAPIGRLIAPATVPTAPSSPKTVAILALALVTGLLVGIGTALVGGTFGRGIRRYARPAKAALLTPLGEQPVPVTQTGDTDEEALRPRDATPLTIGVVPSPFGPHTMTESRPRLIERMRTIWPTVDQPSADVHPAFRAAVATLPVDLAAAQGSGIVTMLLTSEPGFESRSTLALGIAARAAELGLRALVIDADGGRSLLRDLIEPGAQADLLDLMGTTRMCYRVATGGAETIGIVPKIGDESRAVQRMMGREGVRQIDGLRNNFDLVLFDGPAVTDAERFRGTALSAEHIIVVTDPQATRDEIKAMTAGLAVPERVVATVVVAEPVIAPDAAHQAA